MLRKIKKLNGHSGCNVNLMQDNDKNFVSKISSSLSYNYRLKKQCKKQLSFISRSSTVLTPKIINYGYYENLFYFDMDYVAAKTLAEYSETINILEIADFMRCLFKSLYWDNSVINDKANAIFRKKISELSINVAKYAYLSSALKLLYDFDWSNVYKSPCHGDLTLENILVTSDKSLYLIDFLDSFYNSWMIDVAKLLQDLELHWSFRRSTISPNQSLRLQIAKETLIEEILKTENGEDKLNSIYHLLLLNIVRIYPYAKDQETIDYLDIAVNVLMNKLDIKKGVAV